jgi:hypothetical protein
MRCRSASKLIALYCGGDLSGRARRSVARHIASCIKCSALLNEFHESRAWVASYDPPEPSEDFLGHIRVVVHREIQRGQSARQPLRQWPLGFGWKPSTIAAAAAMVLLAVVFIVALLHSSRLRYYGTASDPISEPGPPSRPPEGQSNDAAPDHGARQEDSHQNPSDAATIGRGNSFHRTLSRHRGQALAYNAPLSAGTINLSPDLGRVYGPEPQHPIRIEFQTSDPHIRIIWLTPNYGESEPNGQQAETTEDKTDEDY